MKSQVDKVNNNLLDSRLQRLLLFTVTFILVPLLYFGAEFFPEFQLIVVFPLGLFAFLTQSLSESVEGSITIIAGWLVYIGVTVVAVLTKKRSVFVFLYIIFLVLLAINIAGCNLIIEDITF